MLIPIAKTLPDYDQSDPDKIKACLDEAYQQLLVFVYRSNADHTKYGTFLTGLLSQYLLGQDQYPKTLVDAMNVLSNHHFDSAYADHEKKCKANQERQKAENEGQEIEQCEAAFTQFEGKCWCCGKTGHRSPKCPARNSTPKKEWAINKTQEMQHAQQAIDGADSEQTSNERSTAASVTYLLPL